MDYLKALGSRKAPSREPADSFKQPQVPDRTGQLASVEDVHQPVGLVPDDSEALNTALSIAIQRGEMERALQICGMLITRYPESAEAYCKRGNVLTRLGQWESALADFDHAIVLKHDYVEAYFYRGVVLHELRQFDAAIASQDKAIEFTPGGFLPYMAYSRRGRAFAELKLFDRALESYDRAIALKSDDFEAHYGRALTLHQSARLDDALAGYDQAIALKSDYADVHLNRGSALLQLRRYEAAVSSFDRAIELNAIHARLFHGRGLALRHLKRLDDALACFEQAIVQGPACAGVYVDRANVLLEVGRFEAALASYDDAIAIEPENVEALQGRGFALLNMKRLEAAIESLDRALSINADQKYLPGLRRHLKMQICDWQDFEADVEELVTGLRAGNPVSTPFPMLALVDSPPVHRLAANLWASEHYPRNDALGPVRRRRSVDKIHIAYFSPDFRHHPVSLLTCEMFETHDRSRYSVTAFAFGPRTKDDVRARLVRAFDRFIEVEGKSDFQVASMARNLEVDVAVDLAGYTEHCRTGVFALRAAPVQISYLGYLGTMAAPYMDYLVADATIIPRSEQGHYAEKILYLPSYQANDSKRRIAKRSFTRVELGLPPDGFVYACFNSNYKITPPTFTVWMRILSQVRGSNLFLYVGDPVAERNIRKEAELRGVDGRRIVFGEKLPFEEYLARFQSVDLFLDTLPYNAGTTASDALWAGLPVLTCTGEAFAGRVAASLLTAMELPELITNTPSEYERLAVKLATEPGLMANMRQKLAANRLAAPLFNTPQFTRTLETAYLRTYERYLAGLEPDHIYIERSV
jgi:predicted O-linked N-acetylglucosamine transferase (SPINDLY family)